MPSSQSRSKNSLWAASALHEYYKGGESHAAWLWVIPRLLQPMPHLPLHLHKAGSLQPHGHHCATSLFCPTIVATWANIWGGCLSSWVQFLACVLIPFINVMHFTLPCSESPWGSKVGCGLLVTDPRVPFHSHGEGVHEPWGSWQMLMLNRFLLVFNIMKDGRVKCKIQSWFKIFT